MSFESTLSKYAQVRKSPSRINDERLLEYDFFRLLDATWSLKTSMELFSSKIQCLGIMMKYDRFNLILVCSRYINEGSNTKSSNSNFPDCWSLFKAILDQMLSKGGKLSNELALSLARLLFIAALIFNMPEQENIENIVSNPKARPPNGLFLASMEDIAFSKTLPGDLNGPFKSMSAVLINLKENLQYYFVEIEKL